MPGILPYEDNINDIPSLTPTTTISDIGMPPIDFNSPVVSQITPRPAQVELPSQTMSPLPPMQTEEVASTVSVNDNRRDSNDSDGNLSFYLPKYDYSDYINTLSSWQKQIRDINGEIGWFYFKLFFKFDTAYGLFGGIDTEVKSVNCALDYLNNISNYTFQYASCKIQDRMEALYKFTNILKHISLDVPWYFKGVSGLASLKYPYTSEFQKERSIGIECSEEAIDMRIGTLIDLYKFACFDTINSREIIPANLRKFDMSLILMHVPLKYHHEPTIYHSGTTTLINKGKSLNLNNSFSELASFKMFTFQNCEIDLDGMGELYGDLINNESPFQMGKNKIKIKYDRVFEHRMNEWNEFLLGDDGFYYNNESPYNVYDKKYDFFGTINAEDDDSIHRTILDEISANHNIGPDKLVSYSDYFLNKVYEGTIGTNLNALIDNIRNGVNDVKNQWQGVGQNFGNAINVWRG